MNPKNTARKMKKYIDFSAKGILFALVFVMTGCLSDGDETVSLEFANVKKMIVGEWVLESNSGTPRVLTFTDDGYYTDSSDGGTKKHPWRLASDYSDGQPYYGGIYLDGVYYDIVSWGDGHWRLKDRNGKILDFSRDGGTENNGDDEGNASDNSKTTRLKSITHYDGYSTESGSLTYDEAGRIIRYDLVEGSKKYTFYYSYVRTGEIKHSSTYNSSQSIIYTINNGKMVKKVVKDGSLDRIVCNYTYKNNKLAERKEVYESGHSYIYDYSWNGNNLKELSVFYDGKIDQKWVWKYNNIKTHPLVHALFGFHAYWEDSTPWLDEVSEILPIYDYLGSLPANLFSEISCTDYAEAEYYGEAPMPWIGNVSYNVDDAGNIVKITVNNKESYTLTWEKFK